MKQNFRKTVINLERRFIKWIQKIYLNQNQEELMF